MMVKLSECIFSIEDHDFLKKNIMIFGIESEIAPKK